MNECPYGDSCPAVLSNQNKIDLLTQKIDIQSQHTNEKLDEMCSDVKEIKVFLNERLDDKIDERVAMAMDKYQARIFRWIIATLLSSGGLSAILTLILSK